MARLLFLAHRLPYPPDKGDKVRSYHLLRHLAAQHRVFVGTFVDDPDDERHLPALQQMCAGLHVCRLEPRRARLASLAGLLDGQPLTLHHYRSAELQRWVDRCIDEHEIDAAVVFSSAMAPYVAQRPKLPVLLDLVDVDSAKWTQYAAHHRWPMSWLYRREGRTLLAFERASVLQARQSFLVTPQEVALFQRLAPECAGRVAVSGNGVDAEYFAPDPARASPFPADEIPLVFTGAMDYWPNVDAASWFAREILPLLRRDWPRARFHVVGRHPTAELRTLQGEAVNVAGAVPDMRPYLQHAAVVVAPLRVARGIQNKILEAMAMGRPVVTSPSCAQAMQAQPGRQLLAAEDAADQVAAIATLLRAPQQARTMGLQARDWVLDNFSWPAQLAGFDEALQQCLGVRGEAPVPPPRQCERGAGGL